MTGRRNPSRELPIRAPVDTGHGPERRPSASEPAAAAALPDLREEDLHALLVAFYDAVERDDLLAPFFAAVDMRAHMHRIVDFWSAIVFRSGRYTGNAFRPHLSMPGLTTTHFRRWVATLESTIDERFAGPNAALMRDMAHRIAWSMQIRLGLSPAEPDSAH